MTGAYVGLYVALDWISLIEPVGVLGITPWNPPAGLSLAFFLRYGIRFIPIAFVAVVLADLLFRGISAHPFAVASSALVLTAGYAGASVVLRERLGMSLRLDSGRDLLSLLVVALVGPAFIISAVVAVFVATGLLPLSDATTVAVRFWVGDVIGIAGLTPFLLLYIFNRDRAPASPGQSVYAEYGLQLVAIAAGLWIIFGIESTDHFEFSYVLFLPLIWIALRHGLRGATWGIVATQIGLAFAIHWQSYDIAIVIQFQLLMLAVTVTGLFLGAAVDQQRRAENSLRDSRAWLQTVISTAPDAILTFLGTGAVVSTNRAALAMFGIDPVRPANLGDMLPDLRLNRLRATAGTEMTARRADGTDFVVETAIGEANSGGQPLYVAVVRDLSERKQAEILRKEHEADLAHAARLATTGEMAAALAHELNQPLTALIGFARACQAAIRMPADADTADIDTPSDLIDRTVEQAMRAGEIIRTTREFLGRGDIRRARAELPHLFGEVLNLVRAEAVQQGVRLTLQTAADLPAAFVDPIQIEQVILNLVRNSIEAISRAGSEKREIEMAASLAAEWPGYALISVRDSGPGFNAAMAERMFRPFSTTKDSGMGLGLSISRSLVEAHGGRIWAEPVAPGHGADIRFIVPLYVDAIHGG